MSQGQFGKFLDSTLLKPDASKAQIESLCTDAVRHGFATVCIHPFWVPFAAQSTRNSDVRVGTVIGFPLGANTSSTKVFETSDAIKNGAKEVDFVMNLTAFKSGMSREVLDDMIGIIKVAKPLGVITKVIVEVGYLDESEKILACQLAAQAGVDFVKTSTGFGPKGAEPEDVRLLKKMVGSKIGVKAAGGIRTLTQALSLIEAGATRLGTSNAKGLMDELAHQQAT